jgi:hypothetical protein
LKEHVLNMPTTAGWAEDSDNFGLETKKERIQEILQAAMDSELHALAGATFKFCRNTS